MIYSARGHFPVGLLCRFFGRAIASRRSVGAHQADTAAGSQRGRKVRGSPCDQIWMGGKSLYQLFPRDRPFERGMGDS